MFNPSLENAPESSRQAPPIITQLDHDDFTDDSEDDFSDSEIVDIPPSPARSPLAAARREVDPLERSLSKSFSRRRLRAGMGVDNLEDDETAGYGTFGREEGS